MPTILEVRNIAKRFGKIVALTDIDFKISEGEFVYITGASGAGKTTLLKCILRQMLPDDGNIILEGVDIAKLPRKKIPGVRQKMGVVFQDFKVLSERTVRENVEVALAVIGLPKSDWNARVEHVLRLVGLFERSELFPSQLSGGELQRVSLARALVVNPKIILADEPTGNLDWETADKIIELFNLVNREGKTVIMATHNMQVVEKYKHRVIEIKGGVVYKDTGSEKVEPEVKTEPDLSNAVTAVAQQIEIPETQEDIVENSDIVSVPEQPETGSIQNSPSQLDVVATDDTPIHKNSADTVILAEEEKKVVETDLPKKKKTTRKKKRVK